MYKLVKDFVKGKIIFYWLDNRKQRISPLFPSLLHSKEWLIDHYFGSYEGPERRKIKVDRRNFEKNSRYSSKRNPFTNGRRITDRPIEVDIDLAEQKIAKLIEKGDYENL